jgi:hypothetical protein
MLNVGYLAKVIFMMYSKNVAFVRRLSLGFGFVFIDYKL